MKTVIRQETFETNSSSMHSLVITKNSDVVTPKMFEEDYYIPKDGTLSIFSREELYFDRAPFRILSTPLEKLEYLIAQSTKEERNTLIETFKKIYPKVKEIEFPRYYSEEGVFYGEVDHQSKGFVKDFLEKHDISIEQFLKEKKYNIIIDGDEYCEWEKVKKSGLIDLDNIVLDISAEGFEEYIDEDLEEER